MEQEEEKEEGEEEEAGSGKLQEAYCITARCHLRRITTHSLAASRMC